MLIILPSGPFPRFLLSGSEQTISTICTGSLFLSYIEEKLLLSSIELMLVFSSHLLMFLISFRDLLVSLSSAGPMVSTLCTVFKLLLLDVNLFFELSGSGQTISTKCMDFLFLSFLSELMILSCNLLLFKILVVSLSRLEPLISTSCTEFTLLLL